MVNIKKHLQKMAEKYDVPPLSVAQRYIEYCECVNPDVDFETYLQDPIRYAHIKGGIHARVPRNLTIVQGTTLSPAQSGAAGGSCQVPQPATSTRGTVPLHSFDSPPVGSPNRLAVPTSGEGEG